MLWITSLALLLGSSPHLPIPTPKLASRRHCTTISVSGIPKGKRLYLVKRDRSGTVLIEPSSSSFGGSTFIVSLPVPSANSKSTPNATGSASASRFGGTTSKPPVGTTRIAPPPVGLASDTFNGTALSPSWQILNPTTAAVSVSGGELHIQPLLGGPAFTWFADDEGTFVFKSISGDFSVRSHARATAVSNPNLPPQGQYKLGGIMIRNPASVPGDRNTLHVAVGAGSGSFPVAVEDKTTQNSQSVFLFNAIAQASCELRIQRRAAQFTLEYRIDNNSPWLLARVFNRPDLPQTVQVGLMAYSFQATPDMRVSFDEIVFEKL